MTYTFQVNNPSAVDSVTIDTLDDSIYGDLNGQGDCSVPQTIPAGGSYTCSITVDVTGNAGDTITNVATASGVDDDGNPVSERRRRRHHHRCAVSDRDHQDGQPDDRGRAGW